MSTVNRNRTVTVLLAVIALLLVPRLAADVTGQPDTGTTPQPVGITATLNTFTGNLWLFRLWDNGTVESNIEANIGCGGGWCGWEVVPE